MNLEGIMFREKVRERKAILHIVIYMWNLKQKNEYSKKKRKMKEKCRQMHPEYNRLDIHVKSLESDSLLLDT